MFFKNNDFHKVSRLKVFLLISLTLLFAMSTPCFSEEGVGNVRGLPPNDDATHMPELGGLLNRIYHNQYGQKRELSECVVLRGSSIKDGVANVPAGGLYYSSETSYDARPLMRDPFLVLCEHAYLVRSSHEQAIKRDIVVDSGGKTLLDESGYRIWFEYATDHYRRPYGEFELIAPSGSWPSRWPLSTSFAQPDKVNSLNISDGIHEQLKDFFMADSYIYGATRVVAEDITFDQAKFSLIEYPVIKDAVFSMERPWVVDIRQESFRWYGNKRVYVFREKDGFARVEVRNWTGNKVLASKILKPSTSQEYHVMDQENMCLTDFDLDIHIEIIVKPAWLKHSDFVPYVNDVPYGWEDGTIALAIYNDLVKVEDGKAWPRDPRYTVRLEANYETGMLQRMTLENAEPFELSDDSNEYYGPTKISEVWDRPHFKVVAKDFRYNEEYDEWTVHDLYVRDCFFQRTDDLVLVDKEAEEELGRENVDLFVGMSPLVVSVMEDTFLQRLADPSYGIPVVLSRFTSYPAVIPDAKWFAPDPTAAFVPKLKGFFRKKVGPSLISTEVFVIRGSYVDYRNGDIIIPPGGMYYSSRDNRNIRPGESLYILGKKAYLLGFNSYLVVKRDFRIDRWKEQPMGDGNLLFWQDIPLGDGSKAMRYMGASILWGRPVAELRVTKYSGNTWGANVMVANGLFDYDDFPDAVPEGNYPEDFRYYVPEVFAEGATYLIPKWVTPDFVEVEEMGTPGMNNFTITYTEPEEIYLMEGEEAFVGDYTLVAKKVDTVNLSVDCELKDGEGKVLATKTFGPLTEDVLSTLPQYAPSQKKIQWMYNDEIHVSLVVGEGFEGFEDGVVEFRGAANFVTFNRDTPWPGDDRFVIRPDVCGHCYQLNELILDNKDPIILNEENNIFSGPIVSVLDKNEEGERYTEDRPFFKLVIRDFDGEAINWFYLEDKYQKKTDNLAELPRNNVDMMVGVNGTTETFLRMSLLERLAYREVWRLH